MLIAANVRDIFKLPNGPQDAICVTTNGCIRKDGDAVMGRGIALYANQRFYDQNRPGVRLATRLAGYLGKYGNRAFYMGKLTDSLTGRTMSVITFPTKHDWKDASDIELIRTSAEQLVAICDKFNIRYCYLTCPGCANGRLDWETQVRPVIEPILDDRFVIADVSLNHR